MTDFKKVNIDKISSIKIKPELYEADHLAHIDFSRLHSEMKPVERQFINGLLRYYKPSRILEIGVSRGAGTVVILNAISDMPETKLVSIDRLDNFYGDGCTPVGVEAKTLFPDVADTKWKLFTGAEPSQILPEINNTFDFLVLDSLHAHPIETFNFLCALPYLSDGAIVIVHDISLHLFFPNSIAPRILMCSVTAEKLFISNEYIPSNDNGDMAHNIVAFQINADTRKYIENIFHGLMYPWEVFYLDDAEHVRKLLVNHYPKKLIEIFDSALKLNQTCFKYMANKTNGEAAAIRSLKELVIAFENSTSWRVTKPLRAAKRFFKKIKIAQSIFSVSQRKRHNS